MSFWEKLRNSVDPSVSSDVERARALDPYNRADWGAIRVLARKYFSTGKMDNPNPFYIPADPSFRGEQIRETPAEIENLCAEWFAAQQQYGRATHNQSRTLQHKYDSARWENEGLRNRLSSSLEEKARLQEERDREASSHRREIDEIDKSRQKEVASLKAEIGELKIELAQVRLRSDEQRHARKMEYLDVLERRLKDIEGR